MIPLEGVQEGFLVGELRSHMSFAWSQIKYNKRYIIFNCKKFFFKWTKIVKKPFSEKETQMTHEISVNLTQSKRNKKGTTMCLFLPVR